MRPASPSSLKLFDTCGHRYEREKLIQDVTPLSSAPAERGTRIHEQLEEAIEGLSPWPPEYEHVRQWVAEQRALYPVVRTELPMALALVDGELRHTLDWDNAYLRGIADLVLWDRQGTVHVVDWKTGKRRPVSEHALQMKVYAMMAFTRGVSVRQVVTTVYWTATGARDTRTFRRKDMLDLERTLVAAVERVNNATRFPKKRSGLCRGYCPVTDCRFWRPAPLKSTRIFKFRDSRKTKSQESQ